jgi:hypothetical protein
MHVLILGKRNGEAQTRLLESAGALAEYFELDPALVDALKQTSKDKAVRALKEREAVADLLEALGLRVGAIQEREPAEEAAVTAVTEDAEPLPVPFTEGVNSDLDELPPPVFEDGQVEPDAQSAEAPAEEAADQLGIPEAEAEEELPVEEEPEPAPQPKSSRNKSKTTRGKKG